MTTPADTPNRPVDAVADPVARWAALGDEIDQHDLQFIQDHPEAARQYSRGRSWPTS